MPAAFIKAHAKPSSMTVEEWQILQPGDEVVVVNDVGSTHLPAIGTRVTVRAKDLAYEAECRVMIEGIPGKEYMAGRFALVKGSLIPVSLTEDILEIVKG